MYLVVVGWLYVVLMMVVVEAMSPTGTTLGAIVTFFFYGLLPVALVIYLMSGPYRRRIMRAREAAEARARAMDTVTGQGAHGADQTMTSSIQPDTGGHAAGAAQADSVAAVREETR